MTALEEYLIGEPEVDDAAEVPAPEDLDQADWQLRKLGRLRRLMAKNDAVAAAEIARVRMWLEEENAKLANQAAFYERNLAAFHEHLLAQDAKRKSISLPGGTLKARKHPDRVDVVAPDLFLKWAQAEKPELVRTKVEPDKVRIKQLLGTGPSAGDYGLALIDPASGEAAPGVVLVEGEVSFAADTVDGGEVAL